MKIPLARASITDTSSPLRWHPAGDADPAIGRYERALAGLASRSEDAIALSLRLPFCAAQCWCCERQVQVAQPSAVIDDYLSGLLDEIGRVAQKSGGRRDVLQLHLGGGSVNELNASQFARLVHGLERAWHLPADAEMSVECDPRLAGYVQLGVLRGLGFRHVRFGVLDLDETVQQAIGRRHSAALVDDVCGLARESRIECIELELMLGLPHQTEERLRETLQRVLAMAPERLRLSHFRHRPAQAPAQRAIEVAALPDADAHRRLAGLTAQWLCEAGYHWLGADCFVLESDPLWLARERGTLRRSQHAYTATPATPVLGLGAGATGDIDGCRIWNEPSVALWRQALSAGGLPVAHVQPGSDEDDHRRRAVESLWCDLELTQDNARGPLAAGYERLAGLEARGLVRRLEDRVVVTDAGRHELAALCSELGDSPLAGFGQEIRWLC